MASSDQLSKRGGGGAGRPTEKPCHYKYLKEFRVEPCSLFPVHKCKNHRPFNCFNWHFPNQRRRRSVRAKDGTFNYSPDIYCENYDEKIGTCPVGDECPHLHHTSGDSERRYHLRYYKTSMCLHGTDARGSCTENGPHCTFAHGEDDKRMPVMDATEEQQAMALDPDTGKEHIIVDDPKWKDSNYVLLKYKTDPCKMGPRLCRQGYACPQYHNLRDRRRAPNLFKYRSTACPNVKLGDEWGEPTLCEDQDECHYCHTRTEQQFHLKVYKSSKCNDMAKKSHCPRGQFCAFAHADIEMSMNRSRVNPKVLDTTEKSPGPRKEESTPSVSIQKSSNSCNPSTESSVESVIATSSTKMNVMGPSLMDNHVVHSLIPVRKVELPQAPTPTPTLTNTTTAKEDYEPRPQPPNLEKGSMMGGGIPVSPDRQNLSNNMNGAKASSWTPPVMTPADPQKSSQSGSSTKIVVPWEDLAYYSLNLLDQCKQGLELQLALVKKAISGHQIDSPNYSCLYCRQKYVYRSVTFPCQHQVLCIRCAEMFTHCPLCGTKTSNPKN